MNPANLLWDRLRWVASAKAGPAAVLQTVLTRIFLLFINLANSVFTARHFGAEGRGTQAALGLWLPIIIYVVMVGLPSGLRYQGRKHETERRQLFGAALVLSVVLGIFATIVGITLMPDLLKRYPDTTIRDARIIMLFAPISLLTLTFNAMLEVQLDFSFSNFTRYTPPVLTFVSLVVLSLLRILTPFTAALCYIVPASLLGVVTGIYILRAVPATFADLKRSARRILGYGVRVTGADILSTFSTQVDQLLVIGFLSASQLGEYTIALQASRVLTIFQVSLNSVLLPKASGLSTHRVIELVARTARLTIAVTSIAAIALVLALPFLLPSLYGPSFRNAVLVSQVLALEAILSAGAATHTQAFMATDRPAVATSFQFVGLATSVPLMIVLIPRIGLLGAALALLGSSLLRLILSLAAYPVLMKIPIPQIILRRDDVQYLFSAMRRKRA